MPRPDLGEVIDRLEREFPFPDYVAQTRGSLQSIASTVLRFLPQGASVLDFGAGPCDKTALLQRLGYQCTAMDDLEDHWHLLGDNRRTIREFAAREGIDFRLPPLAAAGFAPGRFDLIMLADVIEHLHHSPRDLLTTLLAFLRPEGFLLLTVPNAGNIRKRLELLRGGTNLPPFAQFYWYRGPWRGHVREYVRGDLVQLASFLGLSPVFVRGCDHMLDKVPRPFLHLYLAITKLFPGLKDSWMLLARKPAGWHPPPEPCLEEYENLFQSSTSYRFRGQGESR